MSVWFPGASAFRLGAYDGFDGGFPIGNGLARVVHVDRDVFVWVKGSNNLYAPMDISVFLSSLCKVEMAEASCCADVKA